MTIPAAVTLDAVRTELAMADAYVRAAGLSLDAAALTSDGPAFTVTFRNGAGELFYAEFDCRDYPLHPPTIEFVDAAGVQRGLPSLYPAGFHPAPCVCMRYNRKAYADAGGPHSDWRLIDWQLATPGGGAVDSLAMMVSDLHAKISATTGRLG